MFLQLIQMISYLYIFILFKCQCNLAMGQLSIYNLCVCDRCLTIALHQRQRQSWSLSTLPHVLSHTAHLALTGRFPSNHWWGIAICRFHTHTVQEMGNTVRYLLLSNGNNFLYCHWFQISPLSQILINQCTRKSHVEAHTLKHNRIQQLAAAVLHRYSISLIKTSLLFWVNNTSTEYFLRIVLFLCLRKSLENVILTTNGKNVPLKTRLKLFHYLAVPKGMVILVGIILHTQTYPIFIFNNILPYGSQGRPFTVVSRSDSAAFVGFELAHWKTQTDTHLSVSTFYSRTQQLHILVLH